MADRRRRHVSQSVGGEGSRRGRTNLAASADAPTVRGRGNARARQRGGSAGIEAGRDISREHIFPRNERPASTSHYGSIPTPPPIPFPHTEAENWCPQYQRWMNPPDYTPDEPADHDGDYVHPSEVVSKH